MVASSARGFTYPSCESRAARNLAEIARSVGYGSQNMQPLAARSRADSATRAAGAYLKANPGESRRERYDAHLSAGFRPEA
jgi:hypothetical protein